MKVAFVLVDFNYLADYDPTYSGSFHLGVGYLSSSLKAAGHDMDLVHLLKPLSKKEYVEKLSKSDADLIAFTSFTHQFPVVTELARWAKEATGKPTICGGVHPTIDPEGAFNSPYLDMICIGEGERALVELCQKIEAGEDYTGIESIWFKNSGEVIRNPVRSLNENLDSISFPDWKIFNYQNLIEGERGRLSILATRGCPYNCTFCSNHRIKEAYPNSNKYVRFRSVDNVLKEIDERIAELPELNHICFIDDTVGLNVSWLEEFAEKYLNSFDLPIGFNSRVEIINNDKAFDLFKKIKVMEVALGVESGNDDIRINLMKRTMSKEDIFSAIARCRESNIRVMTYNIVGLPYEDMSKILETVKLNAKAGSSDIHVSIFQPYPYTRLYDIALKEGFLKPRQEINTFFEDSVLELPGLSKEEIMFAHKNFYIFVRLYSLCYKLPALMSKPLERVLDAIFVEKGLHRPFRAFRPVLNWVLFPVTNGARLVKRFSPRFVAYVKRKVRKK